MLPKVITFFIIFLVVLLTVMFLIYYLYYNNTDRSSFEWEKYYFNGNPPNSSNTNSQCALPLVSAEAQELQILEENADNWNSLTTEFGKIVPNTVSRFMRAYLQYAKMFVVMGRLSRAWNKFTDDLDRQHNRLIALQK